MVEVQSDVFIEDGTFSVDEMEKVRLNGNYQIESVRNQVEIPDNGGDPRNINCQAVFFVGNVLIKKCTENIYDLINVFIRYTHDPCKDLELNMINVNKQMMCGTICPTKKTLFSYKSKMFIAYGRYIFGYDKCYAVFQRLFDGVMKPNDDNNKDEENSYSSNNSNELPCDYEDSSTISNNITSDRIILKNPDIEELAEDYVYAFCIYDQETEIIDAFGLYR